MSKIIIFKKLDLKSQWMDMYMHLYMCTHVMI
jgi:hypothetical protein